MHWLVGHMLVRRCRLPAEMGGVGRPWGESGLVFQDVLVRLGHLATLETVRAGPVRSPAGHSIHCALIPP